MMPALRSDSDPFGEVSREVAEILGNLPKGTILREDPDGSLWVQVKKGDGQEHYGLECREFEA